MSEIQATNNFVFIIRDEAEEEIGGLFIPGQSQEKPHYGMIHTVGSVIPDKNIKKGKKALFHKGNGMPITYNEVEYLVIEAERIIAVL